MNPAYKIFSLACVSALLLSGCESVKSIKWPEFGAGKTEAANTCPIVGVSPELGNITQLRGGEPLSETIIASVKPTCETMGNAVKARLAIEFKGRLGPAAIKDAVQEANYTIPYLIAVVNSQSQIVAKDVFAISMTYKAGQTEQSLSDLIEQSIPLQKGEKASDYRIMVGFQLSPEELAFNRTIAAQIQAK